MHQDTAPIRPGEELDIAALSAYLRGRLDGADGGVEVEQFPGGHSNLTYLLRAGGREYVLRRAPLGPVAPKAHDMAREAKVLSAVSPWFRAAPKVYLLCEDAAVIGAVFFVMERRRGVIIRDEIPSDVAVLPDYPRRISEAFVDCLVEMHAIDVRERGLIALGKPEGFLERQVKGWAERWQRSLTSDLPEMERVIRWLVEKLPPSNPPTLVHNDFKLDNIMLGLDNPARIEAVLDWEMTTVGDPLADLGLTLCYWTPPDGVVKDGPVPTLTTAPGWFTNAQLIERYASRTGRDMTHIGWHEVLGIFKLAVIVQQIYYRYHKGQTRDARFANFYTRVATLAKAAAERTESAR